MDLLPIQIYAVQTASFMVLGVIAALLPRSAGQLPNARHFGWLAAFSLMRGALGLVHLWTFREIPEHWHGALLLLSSICLFEFARRMASDYGRDTSTAWTPYTSAIVYVPVLGGLVLILATDGWPALIAGARYLIALPAGLCAAFVMHRTFQWRAMPRFDRGMARALVAALAAYGMVAGLFVDPVEGLPAWFPTASAAHDFTGLPVALIKTADIILVSITLGTLVHRASARAMSDLRRDTLGLEALAVTLEVRVAERTADLERQQKFAQQLLDVTPAIILVLSPERRIQHVNPAFERLTGWRLDEVRGQDWLEQLPARGRSRIEQLFRVAIGGTPTRGNVNPIVTRAGEEREIEWYDQVLRDGNGSVTGLIAVGIDVTERRQAEEASEALRRRQGNILDGIFAFVGVYDLAGNLLESNRAPLEAAGLERADVIGRPSWEAYWWSYSPETQEQVRSALARAARGEIVREDFVTRISGDLFITIDAMFGPIRDANGVIVEVIGSAVDVTDRKTAEEAARRAGDLLRTVVDGAPVVIFALDREGRFTLSEGRALETLGLRSGQVGASALDVYRDVSGFEPAFRRALTGEQTVLASQVGPVAFEAVYAPSFDRQGRIDGVIGVAFDVTERRRAEQALRESETRLRAIFESEPECVKIVARDGTLLDMNPAGLRLFGASTLDSLRSLRVFDLIDTQYHDLYREAIDAVFRGESSQDHYQVVAADGSRRWMEQHAVPMRDAADSTRVTAMLAVARDVTPRRTMEIALTESEQRLRQAQAIAAIGNWELDVASGDLWWSDEIYRIFEIDQRQFEAAYPAFLEAIHPGDREAVNAAYTASLETREPYHITHRIQTADGRVKHVEERCETDFAADGAPLRSRGTVQEITVRVEAEEALRASVREKETLLREVHHRVKNNLQIVSSLLHFQAKRVKHPDDLAAFADAGSRLRSMSLVHEKLYRSSDLSAIDMRDYLRELIAGMQQSHEAASRSITVTLTADSIRLPVEAAMPVGMIVGELLTNVFKHAFPTDRRNGRAEVSVTVSGNQAEIGVTDNGVGLPETFSPESSESFGWQLVRALTAQLDGELRVAAGAGTRVVINFPTGERA